MLPNWLIFISGASCFLRFITERISSECFVGMDWEGWIQSMQLVVK